MNMFKNLSNVLLVVLGHAVNDDTAKDEELSNKFDAEFLQALRGELVERGILIQTPNGKVLAWSFIELSDAEFEYINENFTFLFESVDSDFARVLKQETSRRRLIQASKRKTPR